MAAQFEQLKDGDIVFLQANQEAIELLESISSVDKASSMPFVKIEHIDCEGNRVFPNEPALSFDFVTPPSFGSLAEGRFADRPPVSIERLSIKAQTPLGMMTFRTVEMSFVIHRPQFLFDAISNNPIKDSGKINLVERESFTSLLLPGYQHRLEYGWAGSSKNGLINGEGIDTGADTGKPAIHIPGRRSLVIETASYSFSYMQDGQLKVTIQCFDSAELNMRRNSIAGLWDKDEQKAAIKAKSVGKKPIAKTKNNQDPKAMAAREKIWEAIKKYRRNKNIKEIGDSVTLIELFNAVLVKEFENALNQCGYKNAYFAFGKFNKNAGTTTKTFGAKSFSDGNIGEFQLPRSEVEKIISSILVAGRQLSLQNFIAPFLKMINNSSSWDRSKSKPGETINPSIRMNVTSNKDKISICILDMRREFTNFTKKDGKDITTRDALRNKLKSKGVPMISMLRGNSYIQDANFENTLDEQMKAIFITRNFPDSRIEVTGDKYKKAQTISQPSELLFSSAIKGTITIIGNFAFDLFSMMWIDFGIKQWDGLFTVQEREDIIDRGGFTTVITIFAEGTDPLGTQGRLSEESKQSLNEKK
jgi:hypothetical protein